jgi:deoxyribodipyrimidine photo-lyase
MKHENGLFIFRRDLRIVDNISLHMAAQKCKVLYPIFIFTPTQVGSGNKYKSIASVEFMIQSLKDLNDQTGGKLSCFYGDNTTIIKKLIEKYNINYVSYNIDYSPFAIDRDLKIIQLCLKLDVICEYNHDYYLTIPGSIKAYQKFTPYYHVASSKHVDPPLGTHKYMFKSAGPEISLDTAYKKFCGKGVPDLAVKGGRKLALERLHHTSKSLKNYSTIHDDLSKETSMLSAYIKFGCVSIREVYKAFHGNSAFIRQLYWRDFYAQILYYFPNVLGHGLKPQYNKIHWHHNSNWFQKWCDGNTGFPIVDAGMRQLNHTGYMHNRARLIVSSFLVKTLLIDWRDGEQYFASKLVDYDVASNNGNWQWTAGSGADAQPYFRIFNPWRQAEEHDPDCIYIKTWIPELNDIPNEAIFSWNTYWIDYKNTKYPKPICDYVEQKEKALQMYNQGLH